jgi:ELWxxDGT repeat protein
MTPEHGVELWKSNGTEKGTELVKDIWKAAVVFSDQLTIKPNFPRGEDGKRQGAAITTVAGAGTAVPGAGEVFMSFPQARLNRDGETFDARSIIVAAGREGVNSGDTLLYGVEVKFYSTKLKLTQALETEVKNLFAVGDGAGVTRGLIQASISGVVAARELLKRR